MTARLVRPRPRGLPGGRPPRPLPLATPTDFFPGDSSESIVESGPALHRSGLECGNVVLFQKLQNKLPGGKVSQQHEPEYGEATT